MFILCALSFSVHKLDENVELKTTSPVRRPQRRMDAKGAAGGRVLWPGITRSLQHLHGYQHHSQMRRGERARAPTSPCVHHCACPHVARGLPASRRSLVCVCVCVCVICAAHHPPQYAARRLAAPSPSLRRAWRMLWIPILIRHVRPQRARGGRQVWVVVWASMVGAGADVSRGGALLHLSSLPSAPSLTPS